MEVVFVIGVLCGIISSSIASEKGNDRIFWFGVGFFLSVLGVIFALLSSVDREMLESEALKRGDSKQCPSCAEIIKLQALKCRYCGEILPKNILIRDDWHHENNIKDDIW